MPRMPSGSKSKQEAARKARLEREAAERAAAERKKRLGILGAALVAIVVVVGIVLAAGVFKSDPADKGTKLKVDGVEINGVKETRDLLRGIPQQGIRLGRADAPATITEFADLKCPICKEHELTSQPEIIKSLVRTGKANLEIRFVNVIDDQSQTARTIANNLAAKNKLWGFVHIVYFNQGLETQPWATTERFRKLAPGAPGVTAADISDRQTAATRGLESTADAMAQQLTALIPDRRFGTPALFVNPRGSREFSYVPNFNDLPAITTAVEDAAKKAKK